MILYRPVGQEELTLIAASKYTAFPPRLPEQPIFYPVLNIAYAREIASRWNVRDKGSSYKGCVLQFAIDDEYFARYPVQTVGAQHYQ